MISLSDTVIGIMSAFPLKRAMLKLNIKNLSPYISWLNFFSPVTLPTNVK